MFNIYGENNVPYSTDGNNSNFIYDVYGGKTFENLIFSDNFDSINTQNWSFKEGVYRNWQYLPSDYSNNAYTTDGNLIIQNFKNNPTENYEWSGAFMDTKNKFSFKNGSVFVRMKFSSADYYHATFWLLGEMFKGEIDLAECDSGRVTAAVHCYDENGNIYSKFIGLYPVDATQFNVYQLDWTTSKLSFKCNGKLLGTYNVEDATIDGFNSLNQPFYLVINTNPYSTSHATYCTGQSVINMVDYIKIYSW